MNYHPSITTLYLSNNYGPEIDSVGAVIILIINSYLFKLAFALIDTPRIIVTCGCLRVLWRIRLPNRLIKLL